MVSSELPKDERPFVATGPRPQASADVLARAVAGTVSLVLAAIGLARGRAVMASGLAVVGASIWVVPLLLRSRWSSWTRDGWYRPWLIMLPPGLLLTRGARALANERFATATWNIAAAALCFAALLWLVGGRGLHQVRSRATDRRSPERTERRHAVALSRSRQAREWIQRPLTLHIAGLIVNLGVLAWANRNSWFLFDEWDPIAQRTLGGGPGQMSWLSAHIDHPFMFGTFFYRATLHLFGLHTYYPYLVPVVAGQLLLTHLLWRLIQRCGVGAPTATAVSFVFGMCGAAYQNLLWGFQMALVWSVVCGIAALLLLPAEGKLSRGDGMATVLLIIGWMFSGVGLVMIAVVCLAAVLLRRSSAALLLAIVPLGLYQLWSWQSSSLSGGQSVVSGIRKAPVFAFTGLTKAFGALVGLEAAGAVLVAVVLLGFVAAMGPRLGELAPAAVTFTGAVVFLVLVSVRRSHFGVDAAASGRYQHIVLALCLPMIAVAVQQIVTKRPVIVPAGLALVMLLAVVQVDLLMEQAGRWNPRRQTGKVRILAAAEVLRRDETTFQTYVDPEYATRLTTRQLQAVVDAGWVPDAKQSTARVLDAENTLQVAVLPIAQRAVRFGGVRLEHVDGAAEPSPGTSGCRSFHIGPDGATFSLAADRSGAVTLRGSEPRTLTIVSSDPTSSARSRPRRLELPAGGGALALGHPGQHVQVDVDDAGPLSLCDLTPTPDQSAGPNTTPSR